MNARPSPPGSRGFATRVSPVLTCAFVAGWLFAGGRLAQALVIQANFDASITNDPNAATIIGTINAAKSVYEASFANPITVTINFQSTNIGLGQSLTYFSNLPYPDYLAALTAAATTTFDAAALAYLPTGPTNPVNGNGQMRVSTANLRALGFADANPPSGEPDGYILLNTSLMNLDRNQIDPAKYDLFAVASHEMDEVLGFGSALNLLPNGAPPPTGPVKGLDLYRYDTNGVRSFDTGADSQAYFSLDGTNHWARFNQIGGVDFSDWWSGGSTPQVQDAFATPGVTPNLGVELIELDVLGYELMAPTLTLACAEAGQVVISWSPNTPGCVLQESDGLAPPAWVNSPSGSIHPVTVAATNAAKVYRLIQQ